MKHPGKKFLTGVIVAETVGLVNVGDLGFSGFCRALGAVLFILFLTTNFLEDEMTTE